MKHIIYISTRVRSPEVHSSKPGQRPGGDAAHGTPARTLHALCLVVCSSCCLCRCRLHAFLISCFRHLLTLCLVICRARGRGSPCPGPSHVLTREERVSRKEKSPLEKSMKTVKARTSVRRAPLATRWQITHEPCSASWSLGCFTSVGPTYTDTKNPQLRVDAGLQTRNIARGIITLSTQTWRLSKGGQQKRALTRLSMTHQTTSASTKGPRGCADISSDPGPGPLPAS